MPLEDIYEWVSACPVDSLLTYKRPHLEDDDEDGGADQKKEESKESKERQLEEIHQALALVDRISKTSTSCSTGKPQPLLVQKPLSML